MTERSDIQKHDGGMCRKCFRSVEFVIKNDEKNQTAKLKIRESMDFVYITQIISIPSPRRTSVTRRMLRPDPPDPNPPDTSGTCSGPANPLKPANPLAKVSFVSSVKLSPFRELMKYRKIAPHTEVKIIFIQCLSWKSFKLKNLSFVICIFMLTDSKQTQWKKSKTLVSERVHVSSLDFIRC